MVPMALGVAAILAGLSMWTFGGEKHTVEGAVVPSATFKVIAPAATQPLNAPFVATAELTDLVLTAGTPSWAGYAFQLSYDSAVVEVMSVDNTLCTDAFWAQVSLYPVLETGCAFYSSTSTGVLETISLKCLKDGTSSLHLLKPGDDPLFTGSGLFDANAGSFDMTLIDGSVTCGSAATPTNTATFTATATATATKTAMATSTATVTGTPTKTFTATATATDATKTAIAQKTQTSVAGTATARSINTPVKTPSPAATATKPPSTPVSVVSPAARTPAARPPVGDIGDAGLPRSGGGSAAGTDTLGGLWLILSGVALLSLGGSMYLSFGKRA